jgi:hypothetical protein
VRDFKHGYWAIGFRDTRSVLLSFADILRQSTCYERPDSFVMSIIKALRVDGVVTDGEPSMSGLTNDLATLIIIIII